MRAKILDPKLVSQYWRDILIVVILAITMGLASYLGARLLNSIILSPITWDVWFQADVRRIFENITSRGGNHYRTAVHPLFSLIAYSITYAIRRGLGIDEITAVRLVITVVASLWISTLFITLRLMSCRRFDATLFSLLGATSAASVFWFVIPETYSFGSLSILLALGTVALASYRKLPSWWYVSTSALTLSFTLTNWMAGILATFVNHPWKRAIQITANAFCLVVLLWGVQKFAFHSAVFFIGEREEAEYMFTTESGGPLQVAKSFIFHTMVMPAIQTVVRSEHSDWPLMLVQSSELGSGSGWGIIATVLWAILLILGLWGLFSIRQQPQLRLLIGLTLLGQLALHLVYGEETFLYALHFGPLLVLLAALGALTRARPVTLVLAGALVISTSLNNSWQFNEARKFLESHGSPRFQVQTQMQLRPTDPWPRGLGHVLLAWPGSHEVDKAYYEPGGSFSPAVGSFGVSLWVIDKAGQLKATSDTIPLDQIQQQLIWLNEQHIPGILTKTSYYQALWSSTKPGRWQLNLKPLVKVDTKLKVVIRSVGPAGGTLQSLDWNGQRLLINDRWSVRIDPIPTGVHLGEEGLPGWVNQSSTLSHWQDERGWGYARLELADSIEWQVVIEDPTSAPIAGSKVASTQSTIELDLPDERFAASLNAQVAHLMMGLVDRQTRPGEPTNYPLSWQRDGAYVIVALARAGQLEVAKELTTYLAENDFFGGFGSEADAPGLAIWALEEVATRLNQPQYDQWLWPHVRRKADFILEMLSTDQPIYRPILGPIVPELSKKPDLTLVAKPTQDGLIVGRMDNHYPLLFVNAVSYRGLLDAASLADRVNQPADAARWRTQAAALQLAWANSFQPPASENPRTYISGLWPTWVATSSKSLFFQGLQDRWSQQRDSQGDFRDTPLWTYFDLAEAHQWLFFNQQERVWTTLRWFWDHQASPGLYTWWEGDGEENTFRRWERVRGWVNPPHVTPHYWTAAEMLSLQLDMLAYLDESADEPTLIIGAGIGSTLNFV